jgi:hypothetical protein
MISAAGTALKLLEMRNHAVNAGLVRLALGRDALDTALPAKWKIKRQAAKARGKRLGNPKLSEARRHAAAAKKEKADRSGRTEARSGLRMMPTSPRSPLSFRTAGFPQYGWKAGLSDGAFPRHRPP